MVFHAIFLQMNMFKMLQLGTKRLYLITNIDSAIINHDHFNSGMSLLYNRAQRQNQQARSILCAHNDRDQWWFTLRLLTNCGDIAQYLWPQWWREHGKEQ